MKLLVPDKSVVAMDITLALHVHASLNGRFEVISIQKEDI